MGIPGSANPLLLAQQDTGYRVQRSIRLNSNDSAFCSRTPSGVGTSLTTSTMSMWVKLGALGVSNPLFSAGSDTSDYLIAHFQSDNTFRILTGENGATNNNIVSTSAVFRDTSAWYHFVVQFDFGNATSTDRIKLYVNGERVTLSGTFAAQGYTGTRFNRAFAHSIGKWSNTSSYFSGYLAEIHFIDGQALTPSSFTEVSATTGQLIPKAYTGSYGTNGFKLTFSDNSGTTSSTLGKDTSGNNNDWTCTNFSVAAGAGNDSLVDTPVSSGTDSGNGGEVRGNYCTWNPNNSAGGTLSNGNLDSTNNTAGRKIGTIGASSGKWYWEITINSASDVMVGIAPPSNPASTVSANFLAGVSGEYGYYFSGNKYAGGTATAYGAAYTSGDVIGVALNMDAGSLAFYKNGVSQGTAFTGLSGTFAPAASNGSGSTGASISANFGQRPFAYTAPSGFKALCDTNLPSPQVAKPSTVFDTKLYTGNGSTQNITGLGFSPDLVWIKVRNTTYWNELTDSVRGVGKTLFSNASDAELTTNTLTAFNTDGFTVATQPGYNGSNESPRPYVAWAWDGGSSTVTNTQGSITSSVRANASAGFSVVSYTGNGVDGATIGHGLNVAPSMIIIKRRDNSAFGWIVGHTSLGWDKFLALHSTSAVFTTPALFNNAAPSSSVFTVGASSNGSTNNNTSTYIAYCWAPVSGYSSMGAFSTATASTDGVFVYTNHRPRWVLIKKTSATGPWIIYDALRNTYNAANNELRPNTSEAENGGAYLGQIDILSNGFKIRSNSSAYVGETGDFVYCSFAESPFQYARAR